MLHEALNADTLFVVRYYNVVTNLQDAKFTERYRGGLLADVRITFKQLHSPLHPL